jgi:5-methylcytosine-specific restriction endonuclease McrA
MNIQMTPQTRRMMNSGGGAKRCVSETKKKYVASQQQWKCNKCASQLTHTFEVDHKIDLRYGGTNHVSNLVALCRNCHGEKTMQDKLQ